MAASTDKTNKPLIPRGVDDRPVDKYNRAELYSGKALDFDGVNDQIIVNGVNNIFDYGNSYTMAGYFKIVDSGSGGLMGNSNGNSFANLLGFVYKSGEDSNFYPDGSSSNYITIYSGNTTDFVYMVCTSDGTTAKAYLNGQLVGSTSVSSYTNTSSRFNVGSSYSGNFGETEATGVKVYSTALTATQVAELYNNPEKVVPTGVSDSALKLWLPMMEGAGTTVYDGSENGNHGTINGATWTHGIGAPVAQTAVIDWNKGTNIFTYSEDFSNADWTTSNLTTTADDATAPDGQTTADKIVATTTNGTHYKYQDVSITNGLLYTFSTFIKSSGADYFRLEFGGYSNAFDNEYAVFNLNTGSVESNGGVTNPTITSYNNDWYRISITATSTASATGRIVLYASEQNTNSFAGDGVNGYYIWGASLEQSATAGPYVHTGATAQTSPVLLPQGLTSGRDITGVNPFENVRKQGALNLDGNSWAEVHDNASLDFGTGSFTIECWAKLAYENTGSSYNGVIGLGDSLSVGATAYIYTRSAGPRFFINGTSFTIAATLDEGNWHHLVVTRTSAGAIQTYYDGAEGEESGTEASTMTNAYDVLIGKDSGASRYYKDCIAQPRIYNRALTASEVLNNYNTTKNLYI